MATDLVADPQAAMALLQRMRDARDAGDIDAVQGARKDLNAMGFSDDEVIRGYNKMFGSEAPAPEPTPAPLDVPQPTDTARIKVNLGIPDTNADATNGAPTEAPETPDETWAPNPQDLRGDGTMKGTGFLGVLKRPDGGVSSELSIGVPINGKQTDIPTLVPTLYGSEIKYLLSTPEDQIQTADPKLFGRIKQKAIDHAQDRIDQGLSPFAGDPWEESNSPSRLLAQIGSGANRGIAATAGLPVDVANNLANWNPMVAVAKSDLVKGALSNIFGQDNPISQLFDSYSTAEDALRKALQTDEPVLGSTWIEKNVMPKPLQPRTMAQRYADAVGTQVGAATAAMLPMSLGARAVTSPDAVPGIALPAAKAVGSVLPQHMIDTLTTTSPAKLALMENVIAANAGIGGQTMHELAPGHPWLEMAGQLAGALGPTAAMSVLRGLRMRVMSSITRPSQDELIAQVGREIRAAEGRPGQLERGLAEVAELQKDAPGFKPSLGETTGSPSIISRERSDRIGTGPFQNDYWAQHRGSQEAVNDFFDSILGIPKDTVGITNTQDAMRGVVDRRASQAADDALRQVSITPDMTTEEASNVLSNEVEKAVLDFKRAAGKLYDKIPNSIPVNYGDVIKEVRDQIENVPKFADRANIPRVVKEIYAEDVAPRLKEPVSIAGESGPIGKIPPSNLRDQVMGQVMNFDGIQTNYGDLRELRSRLIDDLKAERGVAPLQKPNDKKIRLLTRMLDATENSLASLENSVEYPEVARDTKIANAFYANGSERFKRGVIAKISSMDRLGGERVPGAMTFDTLFKPGMKGAMNADALLRAGVTLEPVVPSGGAASRVSLEPIIDEAGNHNPAQNVFHYSILYDGKPVGSILAGIDDQQNANISWLDLEKVNNKSVLPEVRTALRRMFPDVETYSAIRNSGAKGGGVISERSVGFGFPREWVNNPKVEAAFRDAALNDLRKYATDANGKLVASRMAKWHDTYAETLGRFPALDREVSTLESGQRALDTRAGNSARSLAEVQKSAAALMIGMPPETAVERLMEGGNKYTRFTEMKNLVELVKHDPDALNGLRQAVWDYLKRKASTTQKGIFENYEFLHSGKLRTAIEKNGPVLRLLYSPEELARLNRVQRMTDILSRTDTGVRANESATAPLLVNSSVTREALKRMWNSSGWAQNLGKGLRMLGVAGAFYHHPVTGAALLGVGGLETGYRIMQKEFAHLTEQDIRTLWNRALVDPEVAKTFADHMDGASPVTTAARLRAHLAGLGLGYGHNRGETTTAHGTTTTGTFVPTPQPPPAPTPKPTPKLRPPPDAHALMKDNKMTPAELDMLARLYQRSEMARRSG
jgi:hypothetical protein